MSDIVEHLAVFQSTLCEDFLVGLGIFQFPSNVWGFVFDDPVISLFRFCVRNMLTVIIWFFVYWNRYGEGADFFVSWHWGVWERYLSNKNRHLPRLIYWRSLGETVEDIYQLGRITWIRMKRLCQSLQWICFIHIFFFHEDGELVNNYLVI